MENDDRFLKIFAFNLGYTLTDEAFRKAFEPFGNIKDSRLARDQSSNQPRGFGFVVFDNPVSSLKAFEAGVSFDVCLLPLLFHCRGSQPSSSTNMLPRMSRNRASPTRKRWTARNPQKRSAKSRWTAFRRNGRMRIWRTILSNLYFCLFLYVID